MDLRKHLFDDLVKTRSFTEQILTAFTKPEHWLSQVHAGANHPLWVVGHLGNSDNFFISMIAPEEVDSQPIFQERFGMGSQPTADLAAYPPIEQVLGYMRSRREKLLSLLEGISAEGLSQATPPGSPAFLATVADVFRTASWHECMHTGQLTVVRRALGYEPLSDTLSAD